MKGIAALMILMAASATVAEGADWKKRTWKISIAVLGAATIADAGTSWGRNELNPVLGGSNGRFGAQGVSIKAGLAAGVLAGQYFTLRHIQKSGGTPRDLERAYTTFGVVNFASGAAFGAVAARNYSTR